MTDAAPPPFPLPDEALANHIAVLGKTGAGKTFTCKTVVEHLVLQAARICILDPVKSDYWGLISSADGKQPGLPFQILGGPHGHVPLHPSSGKAIAELVASGQLPLCILDMSDFAPGDHARFFNDFAPELLRCMRGVLHLVMEEAHIWAPKERAGIGAESMSIHWANRLATAGRSKGVRLIVATQRTQALHNAVLGSCETVIAHRLTTPADQKPVLDWLKANIGADGQRTVAGSLSSLKTGTAWVCSGELGLFQEIEFPPIATFDNSATPTGDLDQPVVRTAPVDVEKLRAIVGEAVKEAEANDPTALKAEVGRLKALLAKSPATSSAEQTTAADLQSISDAQAKGYGLGKVDGYAEGIRAVQTAYGPVWEVLDVVAGTIAQLKVQRAAIDALGEWQAESAAIVSPAEERARQKPAAAVPTASPETAPAAPDGAKLSGSLSNLLEALAWWAGMGHSQPTRTQLAAKAGLAPKGSTLRANLAALSSAGLVDYPGTGRVRLTDAGVKAAPAPDISDSLRDSIRRVLTPSLQGLFDALAKQAGAISREQLADLVGLEPAGSTLRAKLAELHQLELVEYPARGRVQLQAWARA